jgi:NADH:ubiquinone oxidoreductase subunit E
MMARVAMRALGLEFGETTQDGHIRLSSLRCREQDGSATVVMIDDDSQVIRHPAELRELIHELWPPVPLATTDAILEHARA